MKLHTIISYIKSSCRPPVLGRRLLLAALFGAAMSGPALALGSVAYTYDSLGRLSKATYSNGVVITYFYDAAGNRTSQVTTGVVAAVSKK
jgi:hypothetical protein